MALRISVLAAAALWLAGAPHAFAQEPCQSGYVWREARPGDAVCVTPATREQAARDNALARERREPGGGAHGHATCRQGFVWREALPGDTVCVSPEARAAAARDNAAAGERVASAAPAPNPAPPPAPTQAPRPTPAPTQAAERTTNWSTWGRKSGLQYRYRIRWSPQARPPAQLQVAYEVRNTRAKPWHGAVRSLDCNADTVVRSTRVVLAPNGGGEYRLATPNCGSADRPSFRPNVTESVRID